MRRPRLPPKAAALATLIGRGKLIPARLGPRERAAERGIPLAPAEFVLPPSVPGLSARTLLDVLDGLRQGMR